MTDRELMQKALEALEHGGLLKTKQAITALRAALAQPEPEPVAWLTDREEMYFDKEDARRYSDGFVQPLYTAPPQREWQGLTDGELGVYTDKLEEFARAIEAKLKEKNT